MEKHPGKTPLPFHRYKIRHKSKKTPSRKHILKDAIAFSVTYHTPACFVCQPLFATFFKKLADSSLFFAKPLDILQEPVYNTVI